MDSEQVIREAVRTAHEMINGNMQLITGCRIIRNLIWKTDLSEDDIFLPFIAIDSETDHFPIGKVRELCDLDYLKRIDVEINDYLEHEREYILTSCNELIEKFENK